jgi:hypothetical protein
LNRLHKAWLRFAGRLPLPYTVYHGLLHAAQMRDDFASLEEARAFADDLERRGAKGIFIADRDGRDVPRHSEPR